MPLSTLRIAGVLQRLAATYFVTAATELAAQRVYKKVKVWREGGKGGREGGKGGREGGRGEGGRIS